MTIEEQDSKGNIERNKSLDSIKSDSSASTVPNAAVDYVIAYRFPLKPTGSTSKQHLESTITSSMNELTTRLTKVGLRFQVRTGKEPGTLFILVSSPIGPIRHLYQQQRRRDFLLGVRVNDINSALDSSFEDSITEGERLHLVYELLTLPETDGGAGVSNITDEYIQSIFPLHDEEFNKKWIKSWSHKWKVTDDDLLKIRDQFGEKIAYYFAFLQNYLVWLGAPAALGILVYLTHSNTLAIWYSLSMLVWSILFIEIWERREQELAVKWGVRNYTKHEKNRNEYKGDSKVRDEVTGDEIPFVSVWKLLGRRLAALPGVIVSALFLSLIVGFVFVLQIFLHEYYNGPFHQILHFAPTVGYVLFIPTMTGFYSRFVKSLNNWEMHKTDALWDYHYTQKIFIANFLVGYLSLFITAWIYIPFGDHVLPYLVEFNISHEHKTVDFQRLRDQLVYFIVTGQAVGFLTEMVVPYFMGLLMPKAKEMGEKVTKKKQQVNPDFIQQEQTNDEEERKFMNKVYREAGLEEYNIYTDYSEMVIQFGYVSMFSTVWPLTALCCMLNNWVEIRGDALKICKYTKRPIPHRAESIGPWIGNLKTLVWLSSITMSSFAYLFHPSTNIHSPYTPVFTLLAILLSEHLYVVLSSSIQRAVSMVPNWAENLFRREEYELKKLWLSRVTEVHDKRHIGIDDASDITDDLSLKMWNNHLDRDSESSTAIELIQNAFKVK